MLRTGRCVEARLREQVDDGVVMLKGKDITDPRRVHGTPRAMARQNHLEALRKVGLEAKSPSPPGRPVRRAVATHRHVRALGSDPELLLSDEVTSALDPELVGEVLDLLEEPKNHGVTMILNTHEMGFCPLRGRPGVLPVLKPDRRTWHRCTGALHPDARTHATLCPGCCTDLNWAPPSVDAGALAL